MKFFWIPAFLFFAQVNSAEIPKEWGEDGKCHPAFVSCVISCDFACHQRNGGDNLTTVDLSSNATTQIHVKRLLDCDIDDFEHEITRSRLVADCAADDGAHHIDPNSTAAISIADYLGQHSRFASMAESNPDLYSWSCADNCKYHCMHYTASEVSHPLKFFGKWTFKRVWICQEFLSSAYSFLNAAPYLVLLINPSFLRTSHWSLRFYAITIALMWMASAVFHCRDTRLTMYIDYFSAFAGIVANGWLPAYMLASVSSKRFVCLGSLGLWLGHVSYMGHVKFDFAWNMKLAVLTGLLDNILWSVWYFRNRLRVSFAWIIPIVTWSVVPLFLLMEANDFPPSPDDGLADAHAYWHLGTVPVSALWGIFLYKTAVLDTLSRKKMK